MGLAPWRHRVTIWRASPNLGELDPDLGTFTIPDGRWVMYEGRAMVQDAGEQHPRNASGMPGLQSDATVYLEDPTRDKVTLVEPSDQIEVTYPDGRTADGEVLFARELDAVVLVKYL